MKEEVREFKWEHGIQLARICELVEKNKKDEEDKVVTKEDKRIMETRLEESISNIQKITNTQCDMMNQTMLANQELNINDVEIENMRSQKDLLKKELKIEKEYIKRFNKLNEAIKYIEELMMSFGSTFG